MTHIIAVSNQKGGVAKTTTAAAMGAILHEKGYRILFVDFDAQCNLSFTLQCNTATTTIADLLMAGKPFSSVIMHTPYGDIAPGSRALAAADMYLKDTGKEYKLAEALDTVKDQYDYIIIDTPPTLGILTVNALTAATEVIIPTQADIYGVVALKDLQDSINTIKKYTNRNLTIAGILLTRYNGRTALTQQVKDILLDTAAKLNTKVFATPIREGIAIKEAAISQTPINLYAPNSNGSQDYKAFVSEYLGGTK